MRSYLRQDLCSWCSLYHCPLHISCRHPWGFLTRNFQKDFCTPNFQAGYLPEDLLPCWVDCCTSRSSGDLVLWRSSRCFLKIINIAHIWGNPRQSWNLDSIPWIPDSRYRIRDSLSVVLGFWIPIVSKFRIPGAVFWIPKPRIPDSTSKNYLIAESRFPYIERI